MCVVGSEIVSQSRIFCTGTDGGRHTARDAVDPNQPKKAQRISFSKRTLQRTDDRFRAPQHTKQAMKGNRLYVPCSFEPSAVAHDLCAPVVFYTLFRLICFLSTLLRSIDACLLSG